MAIDLNDTLLFVRVVEEGSFTAAARALRQPKTTVSRKVQELEARLGAQLLHRTTRRLRLTEAGTLYFQHCEPIAQRLKEAEAALTQLQGQPQGWLRVTASYSLMMTVLAPLAVEFRIQHPEVYLDWVLTHETLNIMAREIDVALRLGPLPDSSMAARRLGTLSNRIYASQTYLTRYGEPTHPRELETHRALATRVAARANGYAWPMRTAGAELEDFPIRPVVLADDPEVLKPAVFAGEGLMMATDLIMKQPLAQGRVRAVLPEWTGRSPELNALFPRGHVQSPKVRAFIDYLVANLPTE